MQLPGRDDAFWSKIFSFHYPCLLYSTYMSFCSELIREIKFKKNKFSLKRDTYMRGLAADNNKLYTETMILWNNHYNLNFIM